MDLNCLSGLSHNVTQPKAIRSCRHSVADFLYTVVESKNGRCCVAVLAVQVQLCVLSLRCNRYGTAIRSFALFVGIFLYALKGSRFVNVSTQTSEGFATVLLHCVTGMLTILVKNIANTNNNTFGKKYCRYQF